MRVASYSAILVVMCGCGSSSNPDSTEDTGNEDASPSYNTTGPGVPNIPDLNFTFQSFFTGDYVVWATATDDTTPDAELQYRIYYSIDPNIDSALDVLSNGTPVIDWSSDTSIIQIDNYDELKQYYWNILVRDADNNISSYVMSKPLLLDDDFATNGKFTYERTLLAYAQFGFVHDVFPGANTITITGSTNDHPGGNMFAVRILKSGELDLSFSGIGEYVYQGNFAGQACPGAFDCIPDDDGNHIVIDSEGNTIIAGKTYNENTPNRHLYAIWKFNANGQLDATFNATGVLNISDAQPEGVARKVVLDDMDNILVGGNVNNVATIIFVLSNGSLNTSVGNGTGQISYPGYRFVSMERMSDVIFMLTSEYLIKLDLDGNIDVSFGDSGRVALGLTFQASSTIYAEDMAIDQLGNINIYGLANENSIFSRHVWQYTALGNLNEAFGDNGVAAFEVINAINRSSHESSITLDGNNRIIIGHYENYYDPGYGNLPYGTITRLLANGNEDKSFNGSGSLVMTRSSHIIRRLSVNVDGDHLYIGGGSGELDGNPVLWRYVLP